MTSDKAARKRLILVNSNTDAAITARLRDHANALWSGCVDITSVTPTFGSRYTSSRADAAVSAHAILAAISEAVAASPSPFDAVVIGCFGEPGLGAARESFAFPVVGAAEAGMLTASQVATRFILVSGSERWSAMLRELVRHYGLDHRCAGAFSLSGRPLPTASDRLKDVADELSELVRTTAAEAVVLGGAALTGLATELRDRIAVPVIDSLSAAIGQALVLATLNPRKPIVGSYSHPGDPPKLDGHP
jgi:Asp/Glu/hydantoin racemase